MKTILYSGLTANGNYGSSDTGQMPKQEELNDLYMRAKQAGNIVMGRKTYEIFNDGNFFSGLDVVIVSGQSSFDNAHSAPSPLAALNYLKAKEYDQAFIVGGVTLANAFLTEKLIDELFINVEPYIEQGLKLQPLDGRLIELELLAFHEIEKSGIVQLHYKITGK